MNVKVWNRDHREYVEKFMEREIRIPAGGYVVMGRSEANKFVGQWTPVIRSGTGEDLKPKMLRIEQDAEEFAELTDQPLRYDAFDGQRFRTLEGLKKHESSLLISKKEGAEDDAAVKRGRPAAKVSEAA